MLRHLHIQNYALITHLDIDFSTGFSTITGETGAGKSIILGALGLLMGARADSKAITEGEQKCVIEGEFDIEAYGLEQFFEDNDLDYSPLCSIRRELMQNGKSRSFVNDTPITLVPLKELSAKLIDIHSQHENLLLEDNAFQLQIVDSVAGNHKELMAYSDLYKAYIATKSALSALKKEAADSAADADYIQYQFDQLNEAELVSGEMEELEAEEQQLSHAEDIKSALYRASNLLDGEMEGLLSALKECVISLQSVEPYLPKSEDLPARAQSAYLELKDIAETTSDLAEDTEFDPRRLEFIQDRLDTLNSLLQKHQKQSIDELISLRDELGAKIGQNESYDLEINQLEKQLAAQHAQLEKAAEVLRKTRQKAIAPIKQTLEKQLCQLGIAHATIDVQIIDTDDFTPSGKEDAQILFAANKNQTLRKVQDVASGGEIARLMLCIKALTAEKQGLPTIIFDEIDTGVSGEVASKMGEIMLQIASGRQILAITHLPQIAAKGTQHYKVYKQDTAERTETNICLLTQEERIGELAKMLSGDKLSEAALENARQLMRL